MDHIGIPISDHACSRHLYRAVSATLGYGIQREVTAEQTGNEAATGFGEHGKPSFWIALARFDACTSPSWPPSRAAVDAFHREAMSQGGRDNGGPGLRPHFHAHYHGAFVIAPDGHDIEAVCHAAQ
ncbi:VOC family protein [Dyella sp.]|uniref:VOC family protein n=1 Tax=Dyella sp. TaxID=1869338 RepID=UPI002ED141C3